MTVQERQLPTKGATLRRLRSLHEMSMGEMALAIGVSVAVVSDWERAVDKAGGGRGDDINNKETTR